jgi:methyltransferase (TIGR00027 family)
MPTAAPLVADISDTARWAAVFRARESERPNALFTDPFAARLAGARGFEIAASLSDETHSTSWVVRTWLFDRMIGRELAAGVDTVINLGAGLDARPYRLALPRSLRWIEVDGAEILAYKDEILSREAPRCALERVALDLRDREKRSAFFQQVNRTSRRVLLLCEGVLIYFSPAEAAGLAAELAQHDYFQSWILEVVSPAVLDTMNRTAGSHVSQGISFQFGPAEGPAFLERYGWELQEARSVLKTAIQLHRTPIEPRMHQLLPDVPPAGENSLPWIGVCRFNSRRPRPARRSDSQCRESCESGDGRIPRPLSCAGN